MEVESIIEKMDVLWEKGKSTGIKEIQEKLIKQGRYVTPATYIDYPLLIASIGGQGKRGWIVFILEED